VNIYEKKNTSSAAMEKGGREWGNNNLNNNKQQPTTTTASGWASPRKAVQSARWCKMGKKVLRQNYDKVLNLKESAEFREGEHLE
jgi:hypothetical protein